MKRFGHTIKEHTLTVPWDYENPAAGSFELYAREIIPPGGEKYPAPVSYTHLTLPTICSV